MHDIFQIWERESSILSRPKFQTLLVTNKPAHSFCWDLIDVTLVDEDSYLMLVDGLNWAIHYLKIIFDVFTKEQHVAFYTVYTHPPKFLLVHWKTIKFISAYCKYYM